jgi:hypothetical protein
MSYIFRTSSHTRSHSHTYVRTHPPTHTPPTHTHTPRRHHADIAMYSTRSTQKEDTVKLLSLAPNSAPPHASLLSHTSGATLATASPRDQPVQTARQVARPPNRGKGRGRARGVAPSRRGRRGRSDRHVKQSSHAQTPPTTTPHHTTDHRPSGVPSHILTARLWGCCAVPPPPTPSIG